MKVLLYSLTKAVLTVCKQTWNRNSVLRLERGKLTLVSENAHIKFQHHLKMFMRQFGDRSGSKPSEDS